MLLTLHGDLLDKVLVHLDGPQLARLRTVCKPLRAATEAPLQAWRLRAIRGPDSPLSFRLLRHVHRLKTSLLAYPVDDLAWQLTKAHAAYLRQHLGLSGRAYSQNGRNRYLELFGHKWHVTVFMEPVRINVRYEHSTLETPQRWTSVIGHIKFDSQTGQWTGETKWRTPAATGLQQECQTMAKELQRVLSRVPGIAFLDTV